VDIYLIRHTKTATPAGLCYGRTNVGLAHSFPDDRQQLLDKLPLFSENSLVYTSPLSRCLILAQSLGYPVIEDDRLLEIDFGAWENQQFADINPEHLKIWTANFVTTSPPNGESFNDLCQRVGHFWDELLLTSKLEPILMIVHAGVIRALLAHVLQLPPANAFQFAVDYGSVHKLRVVDGYTYVDYVNK
jgi:alpha-ribazole phosphatase